MHTSVFQCPRPIPPWTSLILAAPAIQGKLSTVGSLGMGMPIKTLLDETSDRKVVARSWLAVLNGHRKYLTVVVEVLNIGRERAEKRVFHIDGNGSSARHGGVGCEGHALIVDIRPQPGVRLLSVKA